MHVHSAGKSNFLYYLESLPINISYLSQKNSSLDRPHSDNYVEPEHLRAWNLLRETLGWRVSECDSECFRPPPPAYGKLIVAAGHDRTTRPQAPPSVRCIVVSVLCRSSVGVCRRRKQWRRICYSRYDDVGVCLCIIDWSPVTSSAAVTSLHHR